MKGTVIITAVGLICMSVGVGVWWWPGGLIVLGAGLWLDAAMERLLRWTKP